MTLLIFLALNLILMAGLFLVGVYLFLQVEDKSKRNKLRLLDSSVDMAELQAMLRAERHDEALQRLMQAEDIDRFSAEKAIEGLAQQDVGKNLHATPASK